jgi:hypothetical protein
MVTTAARPVAGKAANFSEYRASLWTQALAPWEAPSKCPPATTAEVLEVVRNAVALAQAGNWKWQRPRTDEVIILSDVFAKIVLWIRRLGQIGEEKIEFQVGLGAIPWGIMKYVLMVCLKRFSVDP